VEYSTVMEKIRIMIADDESTTRWLLEQLFMRRDEFQLLPSAANGDDAVTKALETKPHVLLCDVSMPGKNGLEVTELVSRRLPECIIIILSAQDQNTYALRAIEAGARDYIEKSADFPEILQRILDTVARARELGERAHKRHSDDKASKIFTFYSPKGGAGTTMLAMNAALELARNSQKTLLVDLNLFFGDIEYLLDLQDRKNISALLNQWDELELFRINAAAETHKSGLQVLYQSRLKDSRKITPAHVGALLRTLRDAKDWDFVLVDLPGNIDERTLVALDMADTLFVVVSEDYLSVKNARLAMEIFRELGYTDSKLHILLNKSTGTTPPHVQTHLGAPFATFPLQANLFEQSVKAGFPPIIEHPSAPFSRAISNLVARSMLLIKPERHPDEEQSGLGRLLKRLFS
jgi:pilus assembly protein CpaE